MFVVDIALNSSDLSLLSLTWMETSEKYLSLILQAKIFEIEPTVASVVFMFSHLNYCVAKVDLVTIREQHIASLIYH